MSLWTRGPFRVARNGLLELRRLPRRVPRIRYLLLHPDRDSGRGRFLRWVLLRHVSRALNRRASRSAGTAEIPVRSLLLGDAPDVAMVPYAWLIDDLAYSSTPVEQWPHTRLLCEHAAEGDAIFAPERFADTAYARHCRHFIDLMGDFQGATDLDGLVDVARDFVQRANGAVGTPRRPHQSSNGYIRVRPIRDSGLYQVVDGHHRVAIAAYQGQATIEARVDRRPTRTALQDHLLAMSWTEGVRQRYQPIPAPELESWTLVRRCSDRFAMMQRFLEERGLTGEHPGSYLDVGACYGWFVRAFAELGFEAHGNERDPLSAPLARDLFDVPPARWHVGEVTDYLAGAGRTFTVVSCLSLMHNYILDGGPRTPEGLLALLDRATERVLFFDMGESHEFWFRRTLQEWTPDHIARWLRDNSTFDEVIALGRDEDAVPPFADNFGRTLFALVRREGAARAG